MYALSLENISDLIDNDPRIGPTFIGTETHAVLGQIPSATIHYKVDETLKARVHLSEPEPGHVVARYAIGGEDHFTQRTNESESMGSFTARVLDFAGNRAVRGLDAPDAIKSVIPILRAKFAKEYTHVEREPFYFDNSAHFGEAPRGKESLQPNDVLVVCPDASRPGVGFARISLGEIPTEIVIETGNMETTRIDTTVPNFPHLLDTQLNRVMKTHATDIMMGGMLTPKPVRDALEDLTNDPYFDAKVTKTTSREHPDGYITDIDVETPQGNVKVWYDESKTPFNAARYEFEEYLPVERTMGVDTGNEKSIAYFSGINSRSEFKSTFVQAVAEGLGRDRDLDDYEHTKIAGAHNSAVRLATSMMRHAGGTCSDIEIVKTEQFDFETATRTVVDFVSHDYALRLGLETDQNRTHIYGLNDDGTLVEPDNGNEATVHYEAENNLYDLTMWFNTALQDMAYYNVIVPEREASQVNSISDIIVDTNDLEL